MLVRRKVPFDDRSMPALHAKIKQGLVEYPKWLNSGTSRVLTPTSRIDLVRVECKHLLSRMLMTNPSARATLNGVMNHPWMTRGFHGPPDLHLVYREPLRSSELDMNVIRGMKGFGFGTEEEIEKKLLEVLESDRYNGAVRSWEHKRFIKNGPNSVGSGKHLDSASNISLKYESTEADLTMPSLPKEPKPSSGFDSTVENSSRRKFPLPSQCPIPLPIPSERPTNPRIQRMDSIPSFRSTFWPGRR